jgi:hypothetical protein
MMRIRRRSRRCGRGGVLFELLLAIAVFAGAAAFALASVKSVFAALDRSRREQMLIDVARSRMAQLECGMISLADLREFGQGVATTDGMSANEQLNTRDTAPQVEIQVRTSRTEFTGLSLVELTVSETIDSATRFDETLSFTLRQFMPLGSQER